MNLSLLRCLAPLDAYRGGERSRTCIATGVDLGMAVVAAEVFVLRYLVRYLHAPHTRVRKCVCVCVCRRGTRHKLCQTRANAPSPQPTDKLHNGGGQRQRPIEGGSGGNGGHGGSEVGHVPLDVRND